jgi:hypothetical protein
VEELIERKKSVHVSRVVRTGKHTRWGRHFDGFIPRFDAVFSSSTGDVLEKYMQALLPGRVRGHVKSGTSVRVR